MISGQTFLGDALFMWGQGTDGATLRLEDTGITLDGLTLFRVRPIVGSLEALVDDASGEFLYDDDSGDVLYDG